MINNNIIDLTRLSTEMKLILYFLSESKSNSDLLKNNTEIDWDLFLNLAQHHRVYPTIFPRLKTSNIPQYIRDNFYKKVQNNTIHMLYLTGESDYLSKQFKTEGIRTLFLKGPLLAYDLYGDISHRTSSDLDVLIPLKDIEKVESFLKNDGYIKDDYIQTVLNDWKWRHHHFTYYHPVKKIKLEIHWRLNPGPSSEPRFDELWKRKKVVNLTPTPIYMLGEEDLFLFLICHGARHGWSRLRWLVDIQYLCNRQLDWLVIRKLLKRYHYLHTAEQALILVTNLFKYHIKDKSHHLKKGNRSVQLARKAMFYIERKVNLHDEHVPEEVADYHKHYLFSLMSWQHKLLYLFSILYPYPMDRETLPLPTVLHFLYFPLRPFLMAWRKAKKQVITQGD